MVEKLPPLQALYNEYYSLKVGTQNRFKMSRGLGFLHISIKPPLILSSSYSSNFHPKMPTRRPSLDLEMLPILRTSHRKSVSLTIAAAAGVPLPPLDLTEDNVRQVLADARVEFGHLFDTSIGMTGQVEFAELDGPFVKISLKGNIGGRYRR
ncbi:uncharacterized protein [Euphorbia lathyris]|uniref:uncharacterized protein isoform X2 n=1 Tax=Euphorbia lathyris TaxID=212925 RepID=UPI00331383AC